MMKHAVQLHSPVSRNRSNGKPVYSGIVVSNEGPFKNLRHFLFSETRHITESVKEFTSGRFIFSKNYVATMGVFTFAAPVLGLRLSI